MSQRFKIENNPHDSKNTRLSISEDFYNCRFNRDELAHISRYLFVCEKLIEIAHTLGRPLRVLDIGCGEIYIAQTLQSSFIVKKDEVIERYVGFDIDEKNLENAAKKKPKSFEIELKLGDITTDALDYFDSNGFDIVICLETIEHISPEFVSGLLQEMHRIAKHFIIFSTPNFDAGTGSLPEDHIKEWGYDELKVLIQEAGIEVLQEIGIFSNLNLVKKLTKEKFFVKTIYNLVKNQIDKNLLSLFMARIVGAKYSQNILRIGRPKQ